MRQRATPSVTTSPLHALVAAVPPEALRELVLELLLNGAAVTPPAAIATGAPRRAGRHRRPAGKPRGRPRKTAATADERKAAAAARHAARKRERRAAERAAKQAATALANIAANTDADVVKPANGSNGNGAKKTDAARLWAHAAKMDAKSPWRPVADEFELNRQATLDAYRLHTLPPGMTADAVERFLELPVE